VGATAPQGALLDFLRLLVAFLERFALWLERGPLGVAWPIVLMVILQLVAVILHVFIRWSRGSIWPVACGYDTTNASAAKTRS
jgi:hypothetical protein